MKSKSAVTSKCCDVKDLVYSTGIDRIMKLSSFGKSVMKPRESHGTFHVFLRVLPKSQGSEDRYLTWSAVRIHHGVFLNCLSSPEISSGGSASRSFASDLRQILLYGHPNGTKIKANVSKHKAMSYGKIKKKKEELEKKIDELLKDAEAVDREEDKKIRKRQEGLGLARGTQKA